MRVLLVITALAALVGCKIDIAVPAGGSIDSDSGLYGCAELETCTVEVDHVFFDERFIANAAPGYSFSHWQRTAGSFCGDRTIADCPNLKTLRFGSYSALLGVLASDTVYTLTPVFVPDTAPAVAPEVGLINLRSVHRQANYFVEGDGESDLLEALQGDDNPLDLNPATGNKPVAQASAASAHGWSWSFGSSGCRLTAYNFEVDYITTMPQLVDLDGKPEELQAQWRDYYARVQEHEAGHQRINRAQHQVQLAALEALLEPYSNEISDLDECGDAIEARWEEIMTPLWAQTEQLQLDYHVEVGTSTPWVAD